MHFSICILPLANAECCDCSKEVDGAQEEEIWTIWNGNIIYCPKCASYEVIGPED
jgi:predicted  nucleic acid-binding Zn-ribbon protein